MGVRTATAPVDTTPRAEVPTARVKLTYEPPVDGLRGVAVAAVVVFHLDHLQGGFLGVDLFFVLSGFLITSLLLAEQRRDGRINLLRFWERRARRLLPALLLVLAGVSLLMLWLTPEAERGGFRGDAFATLGYVANWREAGQSLSYWDIFQQPSPLDHTWSLAIEEQFYLVWPLLVVGVLVVAARRPAALGTVALLGAATSFVLMAWQYAPLDTNRAYFGTDTRLGATLLGAALAAFTAAPRSARGNDPLQRSVAASPAARGTGPPGTWVIASPLLDIAGVAGAAFILWSLVTVDGHEGWYYRGGLLLFVGAVLLVLAAVTGGRQGPLARGLSWAPLRWLGTISYGVYLWHWPVVVYLTPDRTNLDGLALDAVRVAVTLALATASYLLVEQRIREGWLPGWPILGVGAVSVAVTLVAVLVTTSGLPAPAPADLATGPQAAPPDEAELDAFYHLPADLGPGAPKLLMVGDSGAAGDGLGGEMVRVGDEEGVRVGYSAIWCSVLNVEPAMRDTTTGAVTERPWCPGLRRDDWRMRIDGYDPDVVVYYLAWAGHPFEEKLNGEWVTDCDEAYDAYLRDQLGADVDLLASGGATVVLATSPYSGYPGDDARDRVDCRNETYRQVAAAHPGTQVVDMNGFVEDGTADGDRDDWFADDVHLSATGTDEVAHWLVPELLAFVP